MYKPSPILTLTSWDGETDADRFIRLYDEQRSRQMAFITSPEVREAIKLVIDEEVAEAIRRHENMLQGRL